MELRELKKKAAKIEPTIRIGKAGLSNSTIEEIKKQLKGRKLIKIKLLNNFIHGKNKNEEISTIIESTSAELVEKKGFVVTIHKNG